MKISKRVVAMILSFSIVLVNGEKIISYAINNEINRDTNLEAKTINNIDLKEGDKYKKNKIKSPKLYSYNDIDLSEEAIDDLNALWNISYLQKKTDSKYEVALAYENGDYAYLDSTETIEDAMEIANAKSNSIDHNIIPVVIDENGLVIYATEGIGKIVKIIDGKPVSEKDTTKTALIYKTSTTTAEYAAINHAFVDDVPIIEDNGKRVKIQVNGLIGWIDKEDKTGVNIITVPINQSTNLSYYKKTSSGSLQHYISYDVEQSNAGHIKTVGIAPSFMEVNKNYYSYDGKYFYTNINTLISDLKNNTANNSINKNNPYYNYYTYLSGRSKVSYYAKEIENYIQNNTEKDSVLRGQGINFIKAQNKYGVNASLMLGIAMNESS
ncbi:MAG: cell wall-binding protein, partial [Peptostreptococcaceae bacterium]|nr:cell wall-binding protein [Peptostreptococcaceae bacterium]